MVNLTIEEWQRQSSLLLQARPTTTRITTKYNIPNLESEKFLKPTKRKRDTERDEKDAPPAPKVPRGVLTLKTFDPESGVVLKVKTDRAADVGRLINSLGRLGRLMAALPEKTEEIALPDAPDRAEATSTSQHPATGTEKLAQQQQQQQQSGKKKKKGKK